MNTPSHSEQAKQEAANEEVLKVRRTDQRDGR